MISPFPSKLGNPYQTASCQKITYLATYSSEHVTRLMSQAVLSLHLHQQYPVISGFFLVSDFRL
ncbi:Shikimate kinase [Psidium guajava]|nr:Shikimate kinase [Psidium guajava]